MKEIEFAMHESEVNELKMIASVGEAIKRAVSDSEKISLIAINANLSANRAGGRLAGFCVVAGALRRFSEAMAADMAGWTSIVNDLVHDTARGRRQAYVIGKIEEAARASPKACVALSSASKRGRLDLAETENRNSLRKMELHRLISRTGKQRVSGWMIARSAAIEAAYGGIYAADLLQISETIEKSIADFGLSNERVASEMRRVAT